MKSRLAHLTRAITPGIDLAPASTSRDGGNAKGLFLTILALQSCATILDTDALCGLGNFTHAGIKKSVHFFLARQYLAAAVLIVTPGRFNEHGFSLVVVCKKTADLTPVFIDQHRASRVHKDTVHFQQRPEPRQQLFL
jgi:hypothetical protein